MARPPNEFYHEFEDKGGKFFEIAELLYTHPERRYSQDEIAEIIDRSNTTVSKHTTKMVESGWLDRREDQTTFGWNRDAHNPASTEGIKAVKSFYVDFWDLLKTHSNTAPGTFAIGGFAFIIAAIVLFSFYLGFSMRIFQESSIPTTIYLSIAIGSFLSGIIVTFISPLQAVVNRYMWRYLG